MKYSIKQYRPAFFDVREELETVEFDTLEELLAIPWVKRFSEASDFHQFVVSDTILMATQRGGREWWVVGYIRGQFESPIEGLPEWDGGIYEVMIDGKPAEIPGSMVRASYGDNVELRDGRVLKRAEQLSPLHPS